MFLRVDARYLLVEVDDGGPMARQGRGKKGNDALDKISPRFIEVTRVLESLNFRVALVIT